ncbi:MAG: ABC transporter ATP-binding protein [Sphaerochaetaceae bacterium]|nr:ABC transporter ATP-binding protein [Sphaerochaetaceae bacterium]
MLTIKNLQKTFEEQSLMAIKEISFTVHDNEIVMIIGPSGCGKSTLLNIISNNDEDYSGTVQFDKDRIGYVFQEDRLLPWKTVEQNVRIVNLEGDKDNVDKILNDVDILPFKDYLPKNLSGGMRQRCSIARALYYGSDLLLLDEPFKSLDHLLRNEMLKLVAKINRDTNISILYVTHDIDEALLLADRILVLSKRPSVIVDDFRILENPMERDLEDTKFIELKKRIIQTLEEKKENAIYQ